MQHHKPVGKLGGEVEIVQDGKHGTTGAGEIAGDFQNGDLVADIEARGRFIEEERLSHAVFHRLRRLRQHTGKLHALLFATRKRLIGAAFETGEADAVERGAGIPLRRQRTVGNRAQCGRFRAP